VTLWLYILRRFAVSVAIVQGVVLGLVLLFTGVENLRSLARYQASAGDAARLTVLETPGILSQAFPLVLMLGALVCFLGLSRSSELVVIRASGVSALRSLVLPVLVALALGGFAVAVFNGIVVAAEDRADRLIDRLRGSPSDVLAFTGNSLWLRQGTDEGQTVIQAERASGGGMELYNLRLHRYDPSGALVERIEAARARLTPGEWLLSEARIWPLDVTGSAALPPPRVAGVMALRTELTVDQIRENFAPPDAVPFWQLPAFIRQLEAAGFSAVRHRLFLQSELARPLLFAAMVLIGAGFSMRHVRFGQTGVMILTAVLAGFSLYFLKDVSESLGAAGTIPVVLAAWTPPLAAALLALALLLHLEDG
jgi:lipopolysaccharide export system permease protein